MLHTNDCLPSPPQMAYWFCESYYYYIYNVCVCVCVCRYLVGLAGRACVVLAGVVCMPRTLRAIRSLCLCVRVVLCTRHVFVSIYESFNMPNKQIADPCARNTRRNGIVFVLRSKERRLVALVHAAISIVGQRTRRRRRCDDGRRLGPTNALATWTTGGIRTSPISGNQ